MAYNFDPYPIQQSSFKYDSGWKMPDFGSFTPPKFETPTLFTAPSFNFTPPTINIPKYDSAALIKQMNEMLNTTQKTLTETLKKGQEDIMKASMLSANTEAERLNTLIGKTTSTLNKLDEAGIKKTDVKVVVNSLSNLMTNLDKLTAASTGLDIEQNIRTISDAGRNAITLTATNMDKLLDRLNTSENTIKNAKVTTKDQKNEISNLLSQLSANKQILIDTGTSTMEKIAELTKNNISTLQNLNNEKLKIMEATKSIPTQIINNIKATNEMAYEVDKIKADPAMAAYMKKYISKTEEKNGILAAKKSINGVTAFQAMIEYKKNNPIASTLLPKLINVPIGAEVEPSYKITGQDINKIRYDEPTQMKGTIPTTPTEEIITLTKYMREGGKTEDAIKLFYPETETDTIKKQNLLRTIGAAERAVKTNNQEFDWTPFDKTELNLKTGIREIQMYRPDQKTTYITENGKQVTYINGIGQDMESPYEPARQAEQLTPQQLTIQGLKAYNKPAKTFNGITGMQAAEYFTLRKEAEQAEEQRINRLLGAGDDKAPIKVTVSKTYDTILKAPAQPALIDKILIPAVKAYDAFWKDTTQNLLSDGSIKEVYFKQDRDKAEIVDTKSSGSAWTDFINASTDEYHKLQFAYADLTSKTPEEANKKKFNILDKIDKTQYLTKKGEDIINNQAKTGKLDLTNATDMVRMTFATPDQINKFDDKSKLGLMLSPFTANKMTELGYKTSDIAGKLSQKEVENVLNTVNFTSTANTIKDLVSPQTGLTDNKGLDLIFFVATGGLGFELGAAKKGFNVLSDVAKIGKSMEKVVPELKGFANFIKDASVTMPEGVKLTSFMDTLANAAIQNNKVAKIGIIPDAGIIARSISSTGIPSDLANFGSKIDTNTVITKFTKDANKLLDQSIQNNENAAKFVKMMTTEDPQLVNVALVEQIATRPDQLLGTISKGAMIVDKDTASIAWKTLENANQAFKDLSRDLVEKVVIDSKADPIEMGKKLNQLSKNIDETTVENMIRTVTYSKSDVMTPYYNEILQGTEEMKKLVINDAIKIPDIKPLGTSQPGTPLNTVLVIADMYHYSQPMKEALTSLGKYGDTVEEILNKIKTGYSEIKSAEKISTSRLDTIENLLDRVLTEKRKLLTEKQKEWKPDVTTARIDKDSGMPLTMMDEYAVTEDIWNDIRLDWEQTEGISLDPDTLKWKSISTTGMNEQQFNKFVDGISQTTLRDMNIDDILPLSNNAEENTIRRNMLEIAQKQAREGATGVSMTPEMSLTKQSLVDYYEPRIEYAHELRAKVIDANKGGWRTEARTLEDAEVYAIDQQAKKKLAEQEEFIATIQSSGRLSGEPAIIPEMSITRISEMTDNEIDNLAEEMARKYPETSTQEKITTWYPPRSLPTTRDESIELANKIYDEIKIRETGDMPLDTEKALDGDIDAINRIYNKDPVIGEMVDTRATLLAHANKKQTDVEIKRMINAAKNGRGDQAALLVNRMKTNSDLSGYIDRGFFDDITMKDLERLESHGVSSDMTTKLMGARSDAAIKELSKESTSIKKAFFDGKLDFTKEDLKIMTSNKNLENAIDATWNPLGKQTNIIAEAMMKNANDLKEIERLEGLKNIARELVC